MKRQVRLPLTIGAGILISALVAWRQGAFNADSAQAVYRALCDAFFVPGALLCGLGALVFVANGGIFDIFSYGFKSLRLLFTPFGKDRQQHYFEYKQMKAEKRQKPKYYVLKVGLVFLLLAALCLVLFERAG